MRYTNSKYLNIIHISFEDDEVDYQSLAELLMNNPSNMVYFVKKNKLYGLISMGDIIRSIDNKMESVFINKSFTSLSEYDCLNARQIFLNNCGINSIPVIDDHFSLLGEFSRWDDHVRALCLDYMNTDDFCDKYWRKLGKSAIVRPNSLFSFKVKIMYKWLAVLNKNSVYCDLIDRTDLTDAFERYQTIFFIDEEEKKGTVTAYRCLHKCLEWNRAVTIDKSLDLAERFLRDSIHNTESEYVAEKVLKEVIGKGVHVVTLQLDNAKSNYWRNLDDEIDHKFYAIGKERRTKCYREFWEDFFCDKYTFEYAKDVAGIAFSITRSGIDVKLSDCESQYYNVKNGERRTVGQPKEYNKTIYFFGPCFVVGQFVEDADTVESQLQRIFNENGYNVRLVNFGCWQNQLQGLARICSTALKKGDIVCSYVGNESFDGIPTINLYECIEKSRIPSKWFVDSIEHVNYKICNLWAEDIYKHIPREWLIGNSSEVVGRVEISSDVFIDSYIRRYFGKNKPKGIVGSIVMNCNPFTLGHRYLIEKALCRVDSLIIFVVEEDKSLFSFKERFAMVVEGTSDLENISIVPSGEYILSKQTFPEYFMKITDNDLCNNVEYDIRLFGEKIAPKLNIMYRFVGEEKNDSVTQAYNECMKRVLPTYGIEVIEIRRKLIPGEKTEISASLVRKALKTGDLSTVRKITPPSTMNILFT